MQNKNNQVSGAILVAVVICLLALSGLAVRMLEGSSENAREAIKLSQEYRLDMLTESALDIGLSLLQKDEHPDYDSTFEPWARGWTAENLGISITPCNALISLNAIRLKGEIGDRTRNAILSLLESTGKAGDMLDALTDWIDKDRNATGKGFEIDAYRNQNVNKSAVPANDVLKRPEEAFLILGWEKLPPAFLSSHFTIWNDEGRINLNFAPENVIRAFLPELKPSIEQVRAARERGGFKEISQVMRETILANDTKLYNRLLPFITVKSNVFQVLVIAENPEMKLAKRFIVARNPSAPKSRPNVLARDVFYLTKN